MRACIRRPVLLMVFLVVISYGCSISPSDSRFFNKLLLPDFSDFFEASRGKVVLIRSLEHERDFSGGEKKGTFLWGVGGGVIVSSSILPDGNFETKIITVHHVLAGAEKIIVYVLGEAQTSFTAEIIGFDYLRDLALVRIKTSRELSPAVLGDMSKLKIGKPVYAIGHPLQQYWSLSVGFIGNLGQDPLLETVQFDGSINVGSSGGAIFNMQGELIGISAMADRSGSIGFAISADVVKKMLPILERGGRVKNGFLGVNVEDVLWTDDRVENAGTRYPHFGKNIVVIKSVLEGTPAQKVGVSEGDIITEFDGRKVESGRYLEKFAAESQIGQEVSLKILRGDKEIVLRLTVIEAPSP